MTHDIWLINIILAEYDPICIDGKITFFSPCHAGCNSRNVSQITNCGCVGSITENDVTGGSSDDFSGRVSLGSCDSHLEGCHFEVFLALIFVVLFFTFVNGIPATNAILRVVPPELRMVWNWITNHIILFFTMKITFIKRLHSENLKSFEDLKQWGWILWCSDW